MERESGREEGGRTSVIIHNLEGSNLANPDKHELGGGKAEQDRQEVVPRPCKPVQCLSNY